MAGKYNMVVVGAGSAGLVTSYIAAAVKAKVALIERHKMGGDCLNTGCVPSKSLIKTARFVHEMRRHQELGIRKVSFELDFSEVMARIHRIIKTIEPHDSVERYSGLGVECISGDAKILDPSRVEVNGKILETKSIVLAQGAEPFIPPIKGLDSVSYLTSDNLWQLKELPKKLIVLGAGPIGCELAQAFGRLGSGVTVVEMLPDILIREDQDVASVIQDRFQEEGVNILTNTRAVSVETSGGTQYLVCEKSPSGEKVRLPFDGLLVAVGRKARTAGVRWEDLGIRLRKNGTIEVDEYLCANGRNIFAAGDITGPYQFTHTAAHQAYYASVNALFRPLVKFKANYRVVPWVTYTDPEVAQVGLNEKSAKELGVAYEVVKYGMDDLDRAITESDAHGFVKVLTVPGSRQGKILGATIVAHCAGEMNTEFIAGMQHNFGLNQILGTIHPYPTLSEGNKYAAGIWKRGQVRDWIMNFLDRYHSFRRS